MARSTLGGRYIQSKRGFIPNSIASYNMSNAGIGLSAAGTGIKRAIEVVKMGQITAAGNRLVFVAPGNGAKLLTARLNFDVLMYHHATAANVWIFNLKNKSAASSNATMLKNNASLSGVTIAATNFKLLPLNNGNASMNAYSGLQLVITASGTPQTMTNCTAFIEWKPLNNA